MSESEFFSARQAAKTLKKSLNAIYADLWTGRLPGEKQEGKWLIPVEAVQERLLRHTRRALASDLEAVDTPSAVTGPK